MTRFPLYSLSIDGRQLRLSATPPSPSIALILSPRVSSPVSPLALLFPVTYSDVTSGVALLDFCLTEQPSCADSVPTAGTDAGEDTGSLTEWACIEV